MSNGKSNILVSIVCITYNHEPYLRKALDGFLMQQTTFPIEIILAEDGSTDATRVICEEYVSRYPERIRYIVRDHNVGYNQNEFEAMQAARGKYIAFCEGDDYWTIPDKLQRQVDWLETHPDYSVCWHRCRHLMADTGEMREDDCGKILPPGAEGIEIDLDTYFAGWYTQPLTMVFRREALDLSLYHRYRYFRDTHQMYHLLKNGRGYLFAFDAGVRTVHSGGKASQRDEKKTCDDSLAIAEELYRFNRDSYTRNYYAGILQWAIYSARQYGYSQWRLSWRLFALNRDVKLLLKNLVRR